MAKKRTYKRWSKEEIRFLQKYYLNMSSYEIAEKLDRTSDTIKQKAHTLELYKKRHCLWSPEDIKILKKYFHRTSTQKVAEMLGRNINTVRLRASRLGLKKSTKHRSETGNWWSPKEIEYLRKYYPTTGNHKLSEKLGRTIQAIESKAAKLGLNKESIWSPEKVKFLKKHYPTMNTQRIAEQLKHTPDAVRMMASKLGVHKTKKYIRDMLRVARLQRYR